MTHPHPTDLPPHIETHPLNDEGSFILCTHCKKSVGYANWFDSRVVAQAYAEFVKAHGGC
jgi:hypothetical protein